MSKVCYLCGKRPVSGNNVSHSKRRTKRRFMPNLVSMRFGGTKRKVCTACLRTLKKPDRKKVAKNQEIAREESREVPVSPTKQKEEHVEKKELDSTKNEKGKSSSKE